MIFIQITVGMLQEMHEIGAMHTKGARDGLDAQTLTGQYLDFH